MRTSTLRARPVWRAIAFTALISAGWLPLPARAQSLTPADTGLALPIQPERTLRFTTDEGTWISLDVSPDGRSIVFDLLGDLYTLPITGGKATRLTSGMAWDCMPRWSPDGRRIAFISDRDGSDNLWVVNIDGTGARRVTTEVDNALSSPAWTPDGQYLVARRFGPYPGPVDYLRSVPLWMYHVDGGSGTELFPGRAGRTTTNTGPAFSPDGRTMYFGSHAGGYSGENLGSFQIVAYDRETGKERTLTAGAGGGLRPVASRDGRWLVYATRADTLTGLRIRDLQTHEDRWLVGETQRDDQEGYAPNDVFPGYAFTPDSRAVIYHGGGRIRRVDIETRRVSEVPFSADVELGMGARLYIPDRIDDGPVAVTQLIAPVESPDRGRIAFGGVGKIWIADLSGGRVGAPRRLTTGTARESFPAFSPDGHWIAYATWSDSSGGSLWKTRTDGTGAPVRLTTEPGSVSTPLWSPDGERIVFSWSTRQAALGFSPVASLAELRWVPAAGGSVNTITTSGSSPSLVTGNGPDARVWYQEVEPASGALGSPVHVVASVRFDGADRRVHAKITSSNAGSPTVRVSPDQRTLLVLDRDDLYTFPITAAGADGLAVNLSSPAVPLRRVTREGANYTAWADGGRTLTWSFANRYFRASLDTVMRYAGPAQWRVDTITITLEFPRAIPQGRLLLRGARILTMRGDEVVERGDILIENNRIARVGSNLTAPAGARVIDVSGKTIMPGIVDVHAHPQTGREFAPEQEWSIASNLAYGVTTTRNPSGSRWNFAWHELIETGEMVGARIYATGFPLTSTNAPVKSAEDALHVVRRYREQGANAIKQYLQPRRIQRQWILQAGHAEGINVTNEGAGDLKADITMAIDGFTAIEHSIGIVPLYKDVVTVFAEARIAYTPTLVVAYGAPAGDTYWRARTNLYEDEKTTFFTPAELLYRRTRRRQLIPGEDYNFPAIARGVRDIVRAGGIAGLGSHGQQDGIAAHWELWMLAAGDMTPMEALRIATILGAESIGYEQDLGSIEPGKLADLVILNSNPLEDIRNSADIAQVVKNGVLYDGATLDRVWPSAKPFPVPFWVRDRETLESLRRGR